MSNRGPWAVQCRDIADRLRSLQVFVRGLQVVVVTTAGEATVLDPAQADQVHSAVGRPPQWSPHPSRVHLASPKETDAASTAKQYGGGIPPSAAGRPARPPCRGGTTTPMPGPAATPALPGDAHDRCDHRDRCECRITKPELPDRSIRAGVRDTRCAFTGVPLPALLITAGPE